MMSKNYEDRNGMKKCFLSTCHPSHMALKFILVGKEILKYPRVRNILHPVKLFLLAADPFTPMLSYSPQSGFFWGTNFVVFFRPKN
jgi:hypothetical protein